MRWPRLVRYCLALVPVLLAPSAAPAQERLTWSFGYGDTTSDAYGFADPVEGAARQATVTAVADYLSSVLDGRGTMVFKWEPSWATGTTDVLATVKADHVWGTPHPTAIVSELYRQAVGNTPSVFESATGRVNFDLGPAHTWYASGSGGGTPSSSQYDLYSVLLHELTHTMNFGSAIALDGGSSNFFGIYNRFDTFLYKSATGNDRLLNADNTAFNGSASDLTNGSVYWGGEFGVAANNGDRVKLYAPDPFDPGSSLNHVDESGTTADLVMSPTILPGQTAREFSGVEIGMLLDLGWNTYEWDNSTGNWSAGAAGIDDTKWRNSVITNAPDTRVLAPVGEVTHNMVLTFGGSGSTAYTSTNDLSASQFKLNRLRLDSTASVTNTIAGNPLAMSNDNGFNVTPMIEQKNTGAFVIANSIAIPKGLIVGGTGAGQVTLNGVLGGAGGLTKRDSFTLVLGNANTYGGLTTIDGGTVRLAPGGTIPGDVANNGNLQFSPSGPTTYAGAISGAGNLVKDGAGTLTLTGTSTYTGTTAVNAGTLLVNGQTGASAVTVAADATLAGGGQLGDGTGGSLTLRTGGTLQPGDGSSVATLTLNSNESAKFEVGSNLRIAVGDSPTAGSLFRTLGAGDIDLTALDADNRLNLDLFAAGPLQPGLEYSLTVFSAEGTGMMLYPTGGFNQDLFNVTASGFTFEPGYTLAGTIDGLTVTFVPVPEPATVLAVGAAGLGALGLTRRLRRRANAVAA